MFFNFHPACTVRLRTKAITICGNRGNNPKVGVHGVAKDQCRNACRIGFRRGETGYKGLAVLVPEELRRQSETFVGARDARKCGAAIGDRRRSVFRSATRCTSGAQGAVCAVQGLRNGRGIGHSGSPSWSLWARSRTAMSARPIPWSFPTCSPISRYMRSARAKLGILAPEAISEAYEALTPMARSRFNNEGFSVSSISLCRILR